MSAITTGETGPGTPEKRRKFIGGSDVAAIMGVSPWRSAVQVWQDKTGRDTSKRSDDPVVAKVLNRGKRWEPIALEMLIDELQARGHSVEVMARSNRYIDEKLDFLACEIDAEIMLDGEYCNVEIKTVHPFAQKKWGEMDTDEVPIEYAAQVMHGLGITGRRLCVVGCLVGADNMIPYFVENDAETIAAMRDKCTQFWRDHVETDTPPNALDFQDLRILFPKDNGTQKEATEAIADAVRELAAMKNEAKTIGLKIDELEFQIQAYMEPAATLMHHDKKLATWKTQSTMRFDQKAFKEKQPELAAQFTRETESRVFRLSIK